MFEEKDTCKVCGAEYSEGCCCYPGRTVIPKDCIICDLCNKQVSDGKFVATCDSEWYEGWLYCDDCIKKYPKGSGGKLIKSIKKGDRLRGTELAMPIIMDFG
jgi:hypothetical protein